MAHESRYRWVTEQFAIAGKSVLDFGCEAGYGAGILARAGGDVYQENKKNHFNF
jgi:2-polyprenyl-3-methyl-5-hydroxy-6-metoxy-1,4-benzoquinol methylase